MKRQGKRSNTFEILHTDIEKSRGQGLGHVYTNQFRVFGQANAQNKWFTEHHQDSICSKKVAVLSNISPKQ
jgi:hypothetical protein